MEDILIYYLSLMQVGGIKIIQVQDGKEEEFEALYKELQALVRAEGTGNLYYDLFKSRTEKGVYRVTELYEDREAWQRHQDAPYGKDYFPKIRSILAHIEVEYYDVV